MQPGLIFASNTLLRRVRAAADARCSMRSARLFLKGDDDGTVSTYRKSDCVCSDCVCSLSGLSTDVEKSVSGHPCPEFKRIIDINNKVALWMKFVKKKIARQGKDKMGKEQSCQEKN